MPQSSKHVPSHRLLSVAVFDQVNFTDEEFNHLKRCYMCFEQWKQYIHDYVRDEGKSDSLS